MGFNVSTTTMFETGDMVRSNAKSILTNTSSAAKAAASTANSTIFDNEAFVTSQNSQLAIIKAATQISVNSTLNETLKYLKTHANRKITKTPILGELWNIVSTNNESTEENPYKGELIEFQIDKNVKNIFAA